MSPNFYNPYMSKPDYGQGIGDLVQQMIQMFLMKKMMGGGQPQLGIAAGAQGMGSPMQSPQGMQPPPGMPMGPGGMIGGPPSQPQVPMNRPMDLIQMLYQMLQSRQFPGQ